jgi:hypothetical protein
MGHRILHRKQKYKQWATKYYTENKKYKQWATKYYTENKKYKQWTTKYYTENKNINNGPQDTTQKTKI